MTFRSSLATLCGLIMVSAVVLIAFSATDTSEIHVIKIEGMKFVPSSLEVNVGDKVIWENKDIFPHTATSADGKRFDSDVIEAGSTWKRTFVKKGVVPYLCKLHPTMQASVTVK